MTTYIWNAVLMVIYIETEVIEDRILQIDLLGRLFVLPQVLLHIDILRRLSSLYARRLMCT